MQDKIIELLSGRNILVFMIPYLVQNRFLFLSGISSFHCRNFAIYNSYQLNINLKFAILNNIICRKYVCRKDGLQQVNYLLIISIRKC